MVNSVSTIWRARARVNLRTGVVLRRVAPDHQYDSAASWWGETLVDPFQSYYA
jgi:hypothetical protein